MSKKAQIQIGETIAVLFVFFILIIVGFLFYVKIIKGNIETEKEEISQINSIGIANRVMFLPELQCSQDLAKEITNCIDVLKMESAKNLMKQNEVYYYDLLEYSDVTITQIYPNTGKKWNVYSRKIDNFKNKFVTNVPISLCDPTISDCTKRKFGFGVLTIETLSK